MSTMSLFTIARTASLQKTAGNTQLSLQSNPWDMGLYAGSQGKSKHRGNAYTKDVGKAAIGGAAAAAGTGFALQGGAKQLLTTEGRTKVLSEGLSDYLSASKSIDTAKSVGTQAGVDFYKKNRSEALGNKVQEAKDRAKKQVLDAKDKAEAAAKVLNPKGVGKAVGEGLDPRRPIKDLKEIKDILLKEDPQLLRRAYSAADAAGAQSLMGSDLPKILKRRAAAGGKTALVGAAAFAGGKALLNAGRYETSRTLATREKGLKKKASADINFQAAAMLALGRAGCNEYMVSLSYNDEKEKIAGLLSGAKKVLNFGKELLRSGKKLPSIGGAAVETVAPAAKLPLAQRFGQFLGRASNRAGSAVGKVENAASVPGNTLKGIKEGIKDVSGNMSQSYQAGRAAAKGAPATPATPATGGTKVVNKPAAGPTTDPMARSVEVNRSAQSGGGAAADPMARSVAEQRSTAAARGSSAPPGADAQQGPGFMREHFNIGNPANKMPEGTPLDQKLKNWYGNANDLQKKKIWGAGATAVGAAGVGTVGTGYMLGGGGPGGRTTNVIYS
jgi:hypothetical protein